MVTKCQTQVTGAVTKASSVSGRLGAGGAEVSVSDVGRARAKSPSHAVEIRCWAESWRMFAGMAQDGKQKGSGT
jgi:hypothetical protein